MICSDVPGSAADQPKLVLAVLQIVCPCQHIVFEVRSTLPEVCTANPCEVRLDGVIV